MEGQHCLWCNRRQAALFGVNVSRPLPHMMTPKQADLLAVVEGMLSHFFHSTAAVGALGWFYQACFKSPAREEQHILGEPPGGWELRIVQEAQIWCPIPRKVTGPWKTMKGLKAFGEIRCFTPWSTTVFGFGVGLKARKGHLHLRSPHCISCQGSTQKSQPICEPMALQIEHPQALIARILTADLSMDHQFSCPVGWGCRIHRLHLCRGVRPSPPNEYPGYDTKQSNGEVPVMLELWGMWSTPLLLWLPGPFWPGVVAPDRVLS